MKKIYYSLSIFIVVSIIALPNLMAQEGEMPNILLFHADDMNWMDCEPYGNKDVITPSISRLAEEGICLDNMHTSTAMCSPSRQQLYTGLYPVRSGAYPNHSMVHFGVKSLCHHFGDLGYRVALIGKVHHNPFEAFPFEFLGGRHHDSGEGTDIYLDRMKPIIEQDDNPFFMIVSTNQPHSPWNRGDKDMYDENELDVPDYMVDCKETRNSLSRYYAEITYADSLLGRCLQFLEDAGKEENTIVVFTSEQGSSFPFAKWTCYDLGLKTSFIVRWPGKIREGLRKDALTQYIDVVPTLLEATGQDPNEFKTGIKDYQGNEGFDGKSFLDILTGEKDKHRDYVFGIHTTRGIYSGSVCYPIRSVRSKKYKYILNLNSNSDFFNLVTTRSHGIYQKWLQESAGDNERYQYVSRYLHRPKEELYDIISDPYELNNLADDPAYEAVKQELAAELYGWMKRQGDKGIDTEMEALGRQLRFNEDNWKGHEEQTNQKILQTKK